MQSMLLVPMTAYNRLRQVHRADSMMPTRLQETTNICSPTCRKQASYPQLKSSSMDSGCLPLLTVSITQAARGLVLSMSLARRRGESQTVKSAGARAKGLLPLAFGLRLCGRARDASFRLAELPYTLKELGVASQSQTEAEKPEMETRNRPLDF